MNPAKLKFIVLGGGVSGLSTAYVLSQKFPGQVLLLEKEPRVGGLCKTVERNHATYDVGSHRIHHNPRERAFALIKDIAGDSLMKNDRGGRLRLKNSYINYPITSVQMFFGLGLWESFLCGLSFLKARLLSKCRPPFKPEEINYESYLKQKAGARAYGLFYEPYARKVWGCEPSLISITAVKKRVSMVKPTQILQDTVSHYFSKDKKNFYYYLKQGTGFISDTLEKSILKNQGMVVRGIRDFSLSLGNSNTLVYETGEGPQQIQFEKLISTIPFDELILKLNPSSEIRQLVAKVKCRGIKLVYLHVAGEPELPGETFYFPELKYCFGRVSVPKRFSQTMQPDSSYTSLVCEVPCAEEDALFRKSDEEICQLCFNDLVKAHLLKPQTPLRKEKNFVVYLPKVYPLYFCGWQDVLLKLLDFMSSNYTQIYLSGRPGLFLHCNLDHSIDIGLLLADYLLEGKSPQQWYKHIDEFHNMKLRD